MSAQHTSLDKLLPGQQARLIGFSEISPLSRRLSEIGLAPGRLITFIRRAPLRDPMVVKVGTTHVSLRNADAALVTVELIETVHPL